MNVDIHEVKSIKTTQRQHNGGMSFFCLELEVTLTDGTINTVRLFSDQAMTLTNPAIQVVE